MRADDTRRRPTLGRRRMGNCSPWRNKDEADDSSREYESSAEREREEAFKIYNIDLRGVPRRNFETDLAPKVVVNLHVNHGTALDAHDVQYAFYQQCTGAVAKFRLYANPPQGIRVPPPSLQKLSFGGFEIADDEVLADLDVQEDAVLSLAWDDEGDPIQVRTVATRCWGIEPVGAVVTRVLGKDECYGKEISSFSGATTRVIGTDRGVYFTLPVSEANVRGTTLNVETYTPPPPPPAEPLLPDRECPDCEEPDCHKGRHPLWVQRPAMPVCGIWGSECTDDNRCKVGIWPIAEVDCADDARDGLFSEQDCAMRVLLGIPFACDRQEGRCHVRIFCGFLNFICKQPAKECHCYWDHPEECVSGWFFCLPICGPCCWLEDEGPCCSLEDEQGSPEAEDEEGWGGYPPPEGWDGYTVT